MTDTFFCDNLTPDRVRLDAREEEHLFRTLRGAPGDGVRLFDGRGMTAEAVVRGGKELEIVTRALVEPDPVRIDLYLAPPRKQKLDTLLKQCSELGVHTIQLMRTARSVALPEGSQRWRTLLIEGCKQSANAYIPVIRPMLPFDAALEELNRSGAEGFFGAVQPFQEQKLPGKRHVAWVLGPEGGFTKQEEDIMLKHHIRPFHLNTCILRLETAAVAGCSVLKFCAGRLGSLLAIGTLGAALALGSGCGEPPDGTHPLYKKAVKLRESGQFQEAADSAGKYLMRYPESPAGHLMMGSLCDENLNRKPDAVFHYECFLKLAPQSPDAVAVARFRDLARTQAAEAFAPELTALREENKKLRENITMLKRMLFEQQKTLSKLRQVKGAAR